MYAHDLEMDAGALAIKSDYPKLGRPLHITVPPGTTYRNLAESCSLEAARTPAMRTSLSHTANLYIRTAEAIEAASLKDAGSLGAMRKNHFTGSR
ncbi:MAG TPA: hypothetical protein VEW46_03780 [Pyrinomonadaceae bacterium]|nr:hypothetical protein [Pyrinomonadaceae bacterium]